MHRDEYSKITHRYILNFYIHEILCLNFFLNFYIEYSQHKKQNEAKDNILSLVYIINSHFKWSYHKIN